MTMVSIGAAASKVSLSSNWCVELDERPRFMPLNAEADTSDSR